MDIHVDICGGCTHPLEISVYDESQGELDYECPCGYLNIFVIVKLQDGTIRVNNA